MSACSSQHVDLVNDLNRGGYSTHVFDSLEDLITSIAESMAVLVMASFLAPTPEVVFAKRLFVTVRSSGPFC